jgi:predicted MFS family arabinose efflux permease
MTQRQLKAGYFTLAAVNTVATSYYLNYLFFFLRDRFGFGNRENLCLAALNGFIYLFASWQAGRFAQRRGFITSLKLGFGGLALLMAVGGVLNSLSGQIVVLIGYSIALPLIWPALEALVSENESRPGVQHMVGIYNCTWSGAAALAYFTGGTVYDGSHRGTVFWLPAGLCAGQLVFTLWLARHAAKVARPAAQGPEEAPPQPEPAAYHQPVSPRTFLKLAWLANPFSFVAINTLWAVMPGLAQKFVLSPAQVGLFCSVWLFGRLGAFALCWQWSGWHYRFRWLLAAFLTLIVSFMLLLLAPELWLVVLAQVFFGLATGLIYYSSLFYSMDVGGETQGEHGGLHEAAIGAGIFAGPAVGAASLQFFPRSANSGVFAVGGLLLLGLGALLAVWRAGRTQAADAWERRTPESGAEKTAGRATTLAQKE